MTGSVAVAVSESVTVTGPVSATESLPDPGPRFPWGRERLLAYGRASAGSARVWA